MKKTLISLSTLVLLSCAKTELPKEPGLNGLYEVTSKVIERPGNIDVFSGSNMQRMDMEFLPNKLVFYNFNQSEGCMVNSGAVNLSRDQNGTPTQVGCREVTEVTDSSITWSQYEDGQDGVWYITYNLFYIGQYE